MSLQKSSDILKELISNDLKINQSDVLNFLYTHLFEIMRDFFSIKRFFDNFTKNFSNFTNFKKLIGDEDRKSKILILTNKINSNNTLKLFMNLFSKKYLVKN